MSRGLGKSSRTVSWMINYADHSYLFLNIYSSSFLSPFLSFSLLFFPSFLTPLILAQRRNLKSTCTFFWIRNNSHWLKCGFPDLVSSICVAIRAIVSFSIVCTLFGQGHPLGNIIFYLQIPPPERSSDSKASASRDEDCILITRHFTALESGASVIQINGGSRPWAKEGARCVSFFLLSTLLFFLLRFFSLKIRWRGGGGGGEAPRLEPPLQIYRNKGITGLDAYPVKAIGPLHDPVTWYKIIYTGEQVAQWDFQNKGRCIVLEVPLCNLLTSICNFVPCDRVVQRAY